MSSGASEALAATHLLNKHDPSLLTYRQIKDSYGSCLNFMLAYGLKPWNPEDLEQAVAISRSLKREENNGNGNSN